MPTPVPTNRWLGIAVTIALMVSVLSSPIRGTKTTNSHLTPDSLPRNFASVTSGEPRLGISAQPIDWSYHEVDGSELMEEKDEDKSFWSFSAVVCSDTLLTFSLSSSLAASPPGAISRPIGPIPMRC